MRSVTLSQLLLLLTAAAAAPTNADGVFAFDAFTVLPASSAISTTTATTTIASTATASRATTHDEHAALWAAASVEAPPVDRVFDYGRHFKLDEPFKIRLAKGESVLLPLEPIRDLLFPSTATLLLNGEEQQTTAASTQPFAIGLELSNCEGNVQSFVVLKDNRALTFSTASYQCVTVTDASETQQQQANLCPQYDPEFPVAMHVDPAQVKGFILRADVGSAVESIALIRSATAAGGFETVFVVNADDQPRQAPFNVTFSYAETTLAFAAPLVWDHAAPNAPLTGSSVCESCEYFLYAEKLAPNQTRVSTAAETPMVLPYCMRERSSVQYRLPKPTSDANAAAASGQHRHVKVDNLFADQFKASGEYRFVLMASLPSASNHHHPAMLAYAPQQLVVTVPPFYRSRLFIAFVAVALIALVALVQVQYQAHRRFFPKPKASSSDAKDEAEFVSLLARSVSANAASRGETMDSLEEGLLQDHDDNDTGELEQDNGESSSGQNLLLEAIKRTKEQPSAHLEGYHEIK